MVFDWILSPMNSSYEHISRNLIIYMITRFIPRLVALLTTPIIHGEIFGLVLPLIIATISLTLYFGRYRNEEIGWNTAFSNNVFMLFIVGNLIVKIWSNDPLSNKAIFVYCLAAYTITQLILNYLHKIPKEISFKLNSTINTNLISYLAIVIVYSEIEFDSATLLASASIFATFYLVKRFIWLFIPMSRGSKIFTTIQKKKEERERMIEMRRLRRNESLNLNEFKKIKLGITIYLILYFVLFLINKVVIDISEWYIIILSIFFILFFFYYIRSNNLKMNNLLLKGEPIKRDIGILIGVIIFLYYIITSNFFIYLFGDGEYNGNKVITAISIVIGTIGSELFFRGIIQRGLKIRFNKRLSVGVQALLWSLLKADLFNITLSTIGTAIMGVIIIYPIGLLLGYIKEEMWFDSSLSASMTNSMLALISLLI